METPYVRAIELIVSPDLTIYVNGVADAGGVVKGARPSGVDGRGVRVRVSYGISTAGSGVREEGSSVHAEININKTATQRKLNFCME